MIDTLDTPSHTLPSSKPQTLHLALSSAVSLSALSQLLHRSSFTLNTLFPFLRKPLQQKANNVVVNSDETVMCVRHIMSPNDAEKIKRRHLEADVDSGRGGRGAGGLSRGRRTWESRRAPNRKHL